MSQHRTFPCDLCGSRDAIEVPYARLYTNDQPVHICRDCGFVYVQDRRDAEVIAAAWSDELYGEGYTARIPAVLARQTYVADFIDTELGLEGKQLVDIGAGEGQFLEIARDQYGAEVFGIEPSANNCNALTKNKFDCFNGTIEDYAASDDKQQGDIVTLMWTLENCMSCRDMLAGAYGACREGGHLVIATGSRLLVPFKKPLHDYLSENPADTHSFRFSANTLRGLMAVSGFEPVIINRFVDTDYLVLIGQKQAAGTEIAWQGDDYITVADFFERWHKETVYYR